MQRVLKHGGRAGDTDLKKVRIHNADIFVQMMEKFGFKMYQIIKRLIPSKILPLTRDQKTGRLLAASKADRMAYLFEYILTIMKI